jgi:mono/diheme cytochrome c family protein
MAFKRSGLDAYVVSAASNIVVKVATDPSTGAATVLNDPNDNTRVQQIKVGKNPRGIVINSVDSRAYVMNYVSRDVSVIALDDGPERVISTMQSASLPAPGTEDDKIHVGRELYNTSVGVFDPPTPFSAPVTGRMSRAGWGACAACHPGGLTDNVVWIFPAGPRRTIPQHADFDLGDPERKKMRILNWSANRDEQEDFDLNIRAVSGGQGLIVLDDGVTPDPNVNDFTPLANANRNQLKVRGVNAWDGLKAFVQFGIRSPISPVSKTDPDVVAGESLFRSANCQQCHGGASWTSSLVRFTPPPDASQVTAGQITSELRNVGTFDATVFNEIRQNAAAPLGAAGFVPPSLLSIHAFPQTFLHGGLSPSLDDVMNNVAHRSAGTAGVDTLTNQSDRGKLVKFLLSIDGATQPIPVP